jgi:hypothetical protein
MSPETKVSLLRPRRFLFSPNRHRIATALLKQPTAASGGDKEAILLLRKALFSSGAALRNECLYGVDPLERHRWTLLHVAVASGRARCARELLSIKGCPYEDKDAAGRTPLMLAHWFGSMGAIKVLEQHKKSVRDRLPIVRVRKKLLALMLFSKGAFLRKMRRKAEEREAFEAKRDRMLSSGGGRRSIIVGSAAVPMPFAALAAARAKERGGGLGSDAAAQRLKRRLERLTREGRHSSSSSSSTTPRRLRRVTSERDDDRSVGSLGGSSVGGGSSLGSLNTLMTGGSTGTLQSICSSKSASTTLDNWYYQELEAQRRRKERKRRERRERRKRREQMTPQEPAEGEDEDGVDGDGSESVARRQRRSGVGSLWGTVDEDKHVAVQLNRELVWVNKPHEGRGRAPAAAGRLARASS